MDQPDDSGAPPSWEGDALPDWLQGPEDGSDFGSRQLQRIAWAIGRAGALRLAVTLGGTQLTLSERPDPDGPIARAVGVCRARQLGSALVRGQRPIKLEIPFGPFSRAALQRRRIRVLLCAGLTHNEIALRTRAALGTIAAVRRTVDVETGTALPTPAPAVAPPRTVNPVGRYAGDLSEGLLIARAIDLEGLIREGASLPEWLQGPDDHHDLPALLAEIAAVVGRAKALLVGAYLGGARVYIPRKPAADDRISVVLGLEDAWKLAGELTVNNSGLELEIPAGPITFVNFKAWRVRSLILTGLSIDRVALETGINRRNVTRARKQLRAQGYVIPKTWTPPAVETLAAGVERPTQTLTLAKPPAPDREEPRP